MHTHHIAPDNGLTRQQDTNSTIWQPDVYNLISEQIDELNADLRKLSLDIHGTHCPSYSTRVLNVTR